MNRIEGKHVIITGASSGIGRACAIKCALLKANLVLLARRIEKLEELKKELEMKYNVPVVVMQLDVTDRAAMKKLHQELRSSSIFPEVLINSAGVASGNDKFHEGHFEDWDRMIDTNIKGLLNISRTIIPFMVEKNKGHIINIGSIAAYQVYPRGNIYSATKFAVRALTESMNTDLLGTNIRVSCVSPGMVKTEFAGVWFNGDKKKAEKVYKGYEPLAAEDVADAISFVINAPENVNVLEIFLLPTAQRNSYCLHREWEQK